jgi:hypothetical protein
LRCVVVRRGERSRTKRSRTKRSRRDRISVATGMIQETARSCRDRIGIMHRRPRSSASLTRCRPGHGVRFLPLAWHWPTISWNMRILHPLWKDA